MATSWGYQNWGDNTWGGSQDALTGVPASGNVGTLGVNVTVALTGVAAEGFVDQVSIAPNKIGRAHV